MAGFAVELLDWPVAPATAPLQLTCLDTDLEAELRTRLPAVSGGAWRTVRTLLGWVSRLWEHGSDHAEPDALTILDGVAAGARYCCDEYAMLLAQSLNAVGVPAREVGLFRANHHHGHSRAHSVAEAWIDDLKTWVLLDAQNGGFWVDDDMPLSTVQLHRRFADGLPPPRFVTQAATPLDDSQTLFWWSYFATIKTAGSVWTPAPFNLVFQDRHLLRTGRLLESLNDAYPDLSRCWIGVTGTRTIPVIRIGTGHPHVLGFSVDTGPHHIEVPYDEPTWPLLLTPRGVHTATIRMRTPVDHTEVGRLTYAITDTP